MKRGALLGSGLLLAASVSGFGCQSDGSAPTPPPDADFYSCADESRATPYTKGMSVTSAAGAFTVKLLESTFTDPTGTHSEAPAKGWNVWSVEVQDAITGAPLDGVIMDVVPRMPDHAHGTLPVGVTSLGGGTYTLDPVNLYMVGFWQVRVDLHAAASAGSDADAGASVSDTAVFPICISG